MLKTGILGTEFSKPGPFRDAGTASQHRDDPGKTGTCKPCEAQYKRQRSAVCNKIGSSCGSGILY